MSLKTLGRLSVFSALATFCPIFGGVLVLFFGYSIAFYILGVPLLTIGIASLVLRTFILIKTRNEFAKITKAILDAVLIISLVVLSLVFTTAKLVDTETGFKIVQSGTIFGTIGFLSLYLCTLIVVSLTNQKIGKAYLKMRKSQKDNQSTN